MNKKLKILCDAFIKEKREADLAFPLSSPHMTSICANMLVTRGALPDHQRLDEIQALLLMYTDIFSPLRRIQPPVCALLASSCDPTTALRRLNDAYEVMKRYFTDSSYLVYASCILSHFPSSAAAPAAMRTRMIYDIMKGQHSTITEYEDVVMCMLYAMSARPYDELMYETEFHFRSIDFCSSNIAQSCAHVLTLANGQPAYKSELFRKMYRGFTEIGKNYSSYGELIMLAALACVCPDMVTAVTDTADADNYLASKGFMTSVLINPQTRLMNAAMLTAASYTPANNGIACTLPMIAAEFAQLFVQDLL
ncbi:MAG: DUF4003 family protein [Oscillospiraceae bacterium]|nr:DUF4003 family protein [Oscillospiraceae bacterium]